MNHATLILLITTPWVYPFAPGPSPAVLPRLVTFAAMACLLLIAAFKTKVNVVGHDKEFAQLWARAAAWAWLFAGIISSMMALLQYFGAAMAFDPWINQTQYGEAFANLRQRNQFATLTNIALAALVWLALQPPAFGWLHSKPASLRWPMRVLRVMPLLLVAAAVLASVKSHLARKLL
jgi:hypothetical protein